MPDVPYFKRPVQLLYSSERSKSGARLPRPLADLLQMPKSIRQKENEEVAAYTARWLELADAALSATQKAAKALELAREEQKRIRNDIQRRLKNYAKVGRRVKKVG